MFFAVVASHCKVNMFTFGDTKPGLGCSGCKLRYVCGKLVVQMVLVAVVAKVANLIRANLVLNECCLRWLQSIIRAVPRIFCLSGQTPHNPHRCLLYTDRASSWTFCFSPLTQKVASTTLKEKKNTDAFCLKLS